MSRHHEPRFRSPPLASWALVLSLLVLAMSVPAAAQERRFQAVTTQVVTFAPAGFRESSGAAQSGARGVVGDAFVNTLVQVPQVLGDRDAVLWAVQHSYDAYAFDLLETRTGAGALPRGAALGDPPRAPFETLQILRWLWTWRHELSSDYNLYFHHRSGWHGDQLRANARWTRVGFAAALERQWSETHAGGGGLIALWGIGGSQWIPFIRYGYQAPTVRVSVLLPLWARVYVPIHRSAELGLVLEADGNRHRLATPGLPFDNVDLVYSYWGPSFRVGLGHDIFLRADVGLSGLRIMDLYLDEKLQTELDIERTRVFATALSWEPQY